MKKRILALFFALFFVVGITVYAEPERLFSIELDEDFVCAYDETGFDALEPVLKLDKEKIAEIFQSENLKLLAADRGNDLQLRLSVYKNEFSRTAEDISFLDDSGLDELAAEIADESGMSDYDFLTNNGRKYLVFSQTYKDSGGDYTATVFYTVCDKTVYQLSCYNNGKSVSKKVYEVFKTFSLKADKKSGYTGKELWVMIAVTVGIVVFAVVASAMVIGIIRTFKSGRTDGDDVTEDALPEDNT